MPTKALGPDGVFPHPHGHGLRVPTKKLLRPMVSTLSDQLLLSKYHDLLNIVQHSYLEMIHDVYVYAFYHKVSHPPDHDGIASS